MLTYRTEKGAPLTIEEMDGNFREIEGRLKLLEAHLESGEGLGKITVQEDQMTLVGTFGTPFGTFTLPKAVLNSRGTWLSQTSYQKLDLVTFEHGIYVCEKDHFSTQWDQDHSFWHEILSFPKASSSLPLYEKATLPREETLGKLALFMEESASTLIFFDGKGWQRLLKGDSL